MFNLTFDNFVQVKVDIRDVHDLNKLAKHCKMSVLQSELDDAFKKADSFGKIIQSLAYDYL